MNWKVGDEVMVLLAWEQGGWVENEPCVINRNVFTEYYSVKFKGRPVTTVRIYSAVPLELYNSPLYKAMSEQGQE